MQERLAVALGSVDHAVPHPKQLVGGPGEGGAVDVAHKAHDVADRCAISEPPPDPWTLLITRSLQEVV